MSVRPIQLSDHPNFFTCTCFSLTAFVMGILAIQRCRRRSKSLAAFAVQEATSPKQLQELVGCLERWRAQAASLELLSHRSTALFVQERVEDYINGSKKFRFHFVKDRAGAIQSISTSCLHQDKTSWWIDYLISSPEKNSSNRGAGVVLIVQAILLSVKASGSWEKAAVKLAINSPEIESFYKHLGFVWDPKEGRVLRGTPLLHLFQKYRSKFA